MVDDEEDIRQLVADVLQGAGFRVFTAADGYEALALLGRMASVDLLFTDIRMPGMDGFTLAEVAGQLRPGLKVLFTTGYTAHPPGAGTLLLKKPYRVHQLVTTVQIALGADVAGSDRAHSEAHA